VEVLSEASWSSIEGPSIRTKKVPKKIHFGFLLQFLLGRRWGMKQETVRRIQIPEKVSTLRAINEKQDKKWGFQKGAPSSRLPKIAQDPRRVDSRCLS